MNHLTVLCRAVRDIIRSHKRLAKKYPDFSDPLAALRRLQDLEWERTCDEAIARVYHQP